MQTAVLKPRIRAVCIQTADLEQGGRERRAEWGGEVAAAAFLVGQDGGAQPAVVSA